MPVLVISHILEADSLKLTILPIISFFLAAAMIIPAKFAYKKISEAHAPFLLESSFSFLMWHFWNSGCYRFVWRRRGYHADLYLCRNGIVW